MSTHETRGDVAATPESMAAALTAATLKQFVASTEALQIGVLGLTAVAALLPGAAKIDAERLAVVIETLTAHHKDGAVLRPKIAAYVSMVVGIAKELPAVLAEAKAAGAAAANSKN